MIRKKRWLIWSLAGVMGLFSPMASMAASPEFARSSEEWQRLQDDELEYDEIADLIHEYNVTVLNNQYEYNRFIKKYGKTKDDIAESYREMADDLEAGVSGDDNAMSRVSDLQAEQQAEQLREQADDNVEDSRIYLLTHSKEENSLVLSARQKFISYYRKQTELKSARDALNTYKNSLQLAETKRQAGIATQTEALNAQEKVLEQEKNIQKLEQEVENTRQSLILMLGWKGSDRPDIGEMPQAGLEEISLIDVEADQQTAVENNYTLKINERKLENTVDSNNKAKLRNTIDGNRKQIKASVQSAYNSLKAAKLAYEQAVADEQTEERNMQLSGQKWNAGMITRFEYEEQQAALSSKRNTVETAMLDLTEALEIYRANVNGLASAE